MSSTDLHIPVLLEPVLKMVSEIQGPIKTALDGTFGRGGHSMAFIKVYPELRVLGFDHDQQAIDYAKDTYKDLIDSEQLELVRDNFLNIEAHQSQVQNFLNKSKCESFDFILLDLGVSSPQLDQSDRGFSFYNDGPLDMRMDQRLEETAADIVNNYSEQELIDVFKDLGEVRRPFRVVKAIIHDRKQSPFETTRQLAGMIERVDGWRKKGMHPATLYFMGLRLAVNDELDVIKQSLPKMIECLRPGGRLLVISFHSLEDRIVKWTFKDLKNQGKIITKKVIQAEQHEVQQNSRARSAKLRVFERGNSGSEKG